jgi:hypothetical protein
MLTRMSADYLPLLPVPLDPADPLVPVPLDPDVPDDPGVPVPLGLPVPVPLELEPGVVVLG